MAVAPRGKSHGLVGSDAENLGDEKNVDEIRALVARVFITRG
jgi:hypothetical protein